MLAGCYGAKALALGALGRGASGRVSEQSCWPSSSPTPQGGKQTGEDPGRRVDTAPQAEAGSSLRPAGAPEAESGGPTYLVLDVGVDALQHPLARVLVGQVRVYLWERRADTWGRSRLGPPRPGWALGAEIQGPFTSDAQGAECTLHGCLVLCLVLDAPSRGAPSRGAPWPPPGRTERLSFP